MTKELVRYEQEGQEIVQVVPEFAISLQEAKRRIEILQQFVKELMVEGEDYGRIEGIPKPTLLKPGAEKLCDVYGFAKYVEVTNRIEDWDRGFFHYEVKVTLKNKRTGHIEAEGIGSCNSREKKYINQDPYSIVNTLLKMAKKRALIDAVLSATRSSGIFTQDAEDLPGVEEENGQKVIKRMISKKQKNYIYKLKEDIGMSDEEFNALLSKAGFKSVDQLPSDRASNLIRYLENMLNEKYKANSNSDDEPAAEDAEDVPLPWEENKGDN